MPTISKEGLHKPTFHEDCLQAVGKAQQHFKEGLHKPTAMRGLRAPREAYNLRESLEGQPSMKMSCK